MAQKSRLEADNLINCKRFINFFNRKQILLVHAGKFVFEKRFRLNISCFIRK